MLTFYCLSKHMKLKVLESHTLPTNTDETMLMLHKLTLIKAHTDLIRITQHCAVMSEVHIRINPLWLNSLFRSNSSVITLIHFSFYSLQFIVHFVTKNNPKQEERKMRCLDEEAESRLNWRVSRIELYKCLALSTHETAHTAAAPARRINREEIVYKIRFWLEYWTFVNLDYQL